MNWYVSRLLNPQKYHVNCRGHLITYSVLRGKKQSVLFYFPEHFSRQDSLPSSIPRYCCHHHHRFTSMLHSWNQAFMIMGFLGCSPNIKPPWRWEQHEECDRTHLSINSQKMVIVAFTWEGDLRGLKEPSLIGNTLQLTTEVRYLGLILDKGLTWKAQLEKPWVWNPGWYIEATPWWSEMYGPTVPWFGGQGSVTMSAGHSSVSYRD